jgi:hypoxanthine phosphoribosyltransferase
MSKLRVVYSADDISKRLREVASEIAEDYGDRELVLVGMLKGAAFFLADLARMMPRPVDYEFVNVTSSPGDHGETVNLTFATQVNVADRNVLILKDVFHSGVTENYLITHLSQQNPASIEVVAMIDKPQLRSVNLNARYSVFDDVPDGYLVTRFSTMSRTDTSSATDSARDTASTRIVRICALSRKIEAGPRF